MVWWLFLKKWVQFLGPTWQLTTQNLTPSHRNTCRQNTKAHKIKIKFKKISEGLERWLSG